MTQPGGEEEQKAGAPAAAAASVKLVAEEGTPEVKPDGKADVQAEAGWWEERCGLHARVLACMHACVRAASLPSACLHASNNDQGGWGCCCCSLTFTHACVCVCARACMHATHTVCVRKRAWAARKAC